jgi:hypothetical protein
MDRKMGEEERGCVRERSLEEGRDGAGVGVEKRENGLAEIDERRRDLEQGKREAVGSAESVGSAGSVGRERARRRRIERGILGGDERRSRERRC